MNMENGSPEGFRIFLSRLRKPSWLVEGRPWIGWILVSCLILALLSGVAFVIFGLVIIWQVASHGAGELKWGLSFALWWILGIYAALVISVVRLLWIYGRCDTPKNLPKEIEAAESGDASAAYGVARHYMAVDPPSARAWLLKAAQASEPGAMVDLARMLRDGRGGFKDTASARVWLKRAVRAGHPDAAILLGDMESRLRDTFTQRGI